MEKRVCPECGEGITGRIDKKFCSDLCRNAFNNKVNSDCNNYVRNINNALRKNRRILEALLVGEKTTLPRQRLLEKGYNFRYLTSQTKTKNGHVYNFCYEFGYLPLEHDLVLLVKKQRE